MKQTLLLLFLLLGAAGTVSVSAQSTWSSPSDDQYNAEVRQNLNLDYSMPDYSVKKIDEKTIGPRLAKQLQYLMSHYKESIINDMLSTILYEQTGNLRYTEVTKMNIQEISKQGNAITIRLKASLASNPLKVSKLELTMTFIEGVSDSKPANSIFSYISRYIKE